MKALTLYCPYARRKHAQTIASLRLDSRSMIQLSLVTLLSLLCVSLVSVTTIWAISAGAVQYVSASYWAISFIFLALSFEVEGRRAIGLAISGLAFMLLALLASRVAPEFGVLAGFLLSAWVAVAVFKQLSVPDADSRKMP